MKRFDEVLGPLSWLYLFICATPMFVLVFHPSLKELLVFWVADYVALLGGRQLDKFLYPKLFPSSEAIFPTDNLSAIEKCNEKEKLALFTAMTNFPDQRALFVFAISYVKAIPAMLTIVYYWKHQSSNGIQFITLLFSLSIIYACLYGAVLLENHILISQKITEFHKRFNWTEVFKNAKLQFHSRSVEWQETVAFSGIGISTLAVTWIIASHQLDNPYPLGLQLVSVGFCGLTLIFWVWHLRKKLYAESLSSLFEAVENLSLEGPATVLPLHSSPAIAQFQSIFNSVGERLQSYRNELNRWVSFQTEESRYRALGEISALVVHDLSAPLHVIHFCTEELAQKPRLLADDTRYIEQISLNGKKSIELIDSLKTYLKGTDRAVLSASYSEAHNHVTRLLKTQFYSKGLASVAFEIDPMLSGLYVKLTRADFIHVLLNLFRNSFENFMENDQASGQIEVFLVRRDPEYVTIGIRDNGSGLSPDRFEELTSLAPALSETFERSGLGLRLVRRLVERNGGKLMVVSENCRGTLFYLTLRGKITTELELITTTTHEMTANEKSMDC
jgi:signal transduction histidine kinase